MVNANSRNDLKGFNGKAKQQLALAKLSTGTTLLMGFGMYAYGANSTGGDFMITGMAPFSKAERDNFFRQGYNHIHYVKRQRIIHTHVHLMQGLIQYLLS